MNFSGVSIKVADDTAILINGKFLKNVSGVLQMYLTKVQD
jgi:hypothetical protein